VFLSRLTGEEEQIGGFDLIYKNNKRVKNGMKNFSFLGCLNNRNQQMRKMAKTAALRLAEKAKEERSK
jgi:tubulin polyglutamylase TTLL9